MMQSQEPQYPCPKCNQPFPMSQLHNHWSTCQGHPLQQQFPKSTPQQIEQWKRDPYPAPPTDYLLNHGYSPPYPQQQAPIFIPPAPPKHQHLWFENDTYRICLDPTCKQINLKLRGSLFLFIRYGLKIFWIETAVAIGLALYIVSLVHH